MRVCSYRYMAHSTPRRPGARDHTHPAHRALPALLVTLALAASVVLAGCTTDRDDDADRNVELAYEGEEDGSHTDTADCNDDGLLTSTGILEDGNITITVTDGAGDTIYDQTLNGTLTGDSEGLNGEPGEWTVEVERSDGFDGQYIVNLGC